MLSTNLSKPITWLYHIIYIISDIDVTSGPFHVDGKGWLFPAMFIHMSPEGLLIFTNQIVGERVCLCCGLLSFTHPQNVFKIRPGCFISSYTVPCLALPEMIQHLKASRASALALYDIFLYSVLEHINTASMHAAC